MSAEKMREDFEGWWRSEMNVEVMDLHRCEFPMQKDVFVQPYACHETQRGWLSWQASRAAVEVELPSLRSITMGRRENENDSGFNAGVELCIDAIKSLDLKIKQ